MSTALLLSTIVLLLLAYRFYGAVLAKRFGQDESRETPASRLRDGVDYVPTAAPVVLGHHFASIAGAGPIVGPVIAVTFGWLPAALWILFGVVFLGGVHDYGSLMASLRHDGRSIGDVIEGAIGAVGKRLFVVFAIAALVLVIAVFTDIIAKLFVSQPQVATTSGAFVLVAVAFGVAQRKTGIGLVPLSAIGVLLLGACMVCGAALPATGVPYAAWVSVLLVYVVIAAVTPVTWLLQPRDYLNSFLLYGLLLGGIAGVLMQRPALELPAFVGWHDARLGWLFPALFITVACGAVSGFHSLVASGTTSKQLANERDARVVGYGGMLIEGVLAMVAVVAAASLPLGSYREMLANAGPIAVFANGVGGGIAALGVPSTVAVTFVSLAVSAFALTSLDTCTRLARFLVQELAAPRAGEAAHPLAGALGNRFVGTSVVVAAGGGLCLSGEFAEIWPVFGAANQLLAAIALLAVSVWLARRGRKFALTLAPAAFMFAVTMTALTQLVIKNTSEGGSAVLATVSVALLALAVVLLVQGVGAVRSLGQAAS